MAMLVDAFMSNTLKWLIQLATDNVAMMLDLSDDIKNLQATMTAAQAIYAMAEKEQLRNDVMKLWLRDIKSFMYEADDILDLCKTDLAELQRHGGSGVLQLPFIVNPVTAHTIGGRIKKVNKKLAAINSKWRSLGVQINITELVERTPNESSDTLQHWETSSIPVNEVVGEKIKEDTHKLLKVLTNGAEQDRLGDHPCLVVAIVGPGGIGKTTLAQNVFNHPAIKNEFDKCQVWAHVPRVLDQDGEVRLLESVIELLGGNIGGAQTREALHRKLEKVVMERKVMMVLDDMWNADAWERLLMAPLRSCSRGSRIIVTTRNYKIAQWMNAAVIHHVTRLNDEDGWTLLKKEINNG